MKLEIIIATKDRPDHVMAVIDSVIKQTELPAKVTIVDSGRQCIDSDLVRNLVSGAGMLYDHLHTTPGLTHQRNTGVRNSTADVVMFVDDDVFLEKEYVANVMKVFREDVKNEVVGVTGFVTNVSYNPSFIASLFRRMFCLSLPGKGELHASGIANSYQLCEGELTEVDWLSGCNMAYRKQVFQYQLFDENLLSYGYAEDLDFSVRAGKSGKLMFVRSARLEHRMAKENRLAHGQSYKMYVRHHAYLFKKNMPQTCYNKWCFALSLKGILLQALFFKRSWKGFKGALTAVCDVVFFRNYSMPNFLERLDFNHPSRKQIAEHIFRYEYILDACAGKDVLDCASGEGIGMKILSAKAKSVTGLDIDEGAIARAKNNVNLSHVKFVVGSALEIPFPENTFDVVTSVETLEHITPDSQELVLREFKRVLKPNGLLFLTTPNKLRTSPGQVAAKNYFHIGELPVDELEALVRRVFSEVRILGLFNFTREASLEAVIASSNNTASKYPPQFVPLSARKKILMLIPGFLRDLLSRIILKKSIYPAVGEFSLDEQNAVHAADLVIICKKA